MPTTVPIDGHPVFVIPVWQGVAMTEVVLRPVRDEDLDAIFEQMRDPDSVRMAAFTHEDPDDRAAFDAHMARIRARPDVTLRAIVADGVLAGTISSFVLEGETEVTYWVDRRFWGQGVAGQALGQLLELVPVRPLRGRAASDNAASIRVLRRAGFEIVGTDIGFAHARGKEIEETVLRLS
jgi:RimJ/RimL family protein N-acetyltransferase